MRNRLMIGAAALLLASATYARAQDKPQADKPADKPQAETTETNGTLDIGGRFTSTDGDEARYERYRDLRDGVDANFKYGKETASWTFDVKAKNIGYRDGRYELVFNSKRVKFNALFDQTPLNYGYYTSSPYVCTAGDCSLDASLRARVQAKTAVGVPQSAANLLTGSVYGPASTPFDLQSRRDTIAGDLRISATDNIDFTLKPAESGFVVVGGSKPALALGSWKGQVGYSVAGKQGSLLRFPYVFRLTYAPPKDRDRAMPFQVGPAGFKHDEAGGVIYFDLDKKRVSRVEERFHVKGELSVSLLGQETRMELDEDQQFRVRILDENPWSKIAFPSGGD